MPRRRASRSGESLTALPCFRQFIGADSCARLGSFRFGDDTSGIVWAVGNRLRSNARSNVVWSYRRDARSTGVEAFSGRLSPLPKSRAKPRDQPELRRLAGV